jgi:hypothetical protein
MELKIYMPIIGMTFLISCANTENRYSGVYNQVSDTVIAD